MDYSSCYLDIIDRNGIAINESLSTKNWLDLVSGIPDLSAGETTAIAIDEFLREEHHHYYGRPWIVGRFYYDYLISVGVTSTDRVLDVGCGSGRVAIWLVPFLEEGKYFGIDSHLRSLMAFARYEAVLHHLKAKKPRLMLSNEFDIAGFGEQFDVVLDFSVTRNLPLERAGAAYEKIAGAMVPGGRVFMPTSPKAGTTGLDLDDMDRLGFSLVKTEQVRYSLFTESGHVQDVDEWHQFRRR